MSGNIFVANISSLVPNCVLKGRRAARIFVSLFTGTRQMGTESFPTRIIDSTLADLLKILDQKCTRGNWVNCSLLGLIDGLHQDFGI